jgi:hypothetical protein
MQQRAIYGLATHCSWKNKDKGQEGCCTQAQLEFGHMILFGPEIHQTWKRPITWCMHVDFIRVSPNSLIPTLGLKFDPLKWSKEKRGF